MQHANEFETEETTKPIIELTEEERRWMALGRARATSRDVAAQAAAALALGA